MRKTNIVISDVSCYDVLVRHKSELLAKATMVTPTVRAFSNPKGSDLKALNDNIRIISSTKCQISKKNLEFVLLDDRSGVSLRLINFSISNLSGLDASVKFETTGRYNYREQFDIFFNVYSEFLGLDLSNPRIVYQDRQLKASKVIESFDVKCVKKTSGLLDWQYKPCNYTLSISEPFFFIDGGRKRNSQRLSSKIGFNTTLNIGLADINASIVGEELTPIITIDGNGTSSRYSLLSFRLVYSSLSIDEGHLVYNESEFDVNKATIAFNVKFKKEPDDLQDWQYLPCNYTIKVEKPFSFLTNTGVKDIVRIMSDFGLDSVFNLCLSFISDSIVGKDLSPNLMVSSIHNTNVTKTLISFKLEYSDLMINNIKELIPNPIIVDTAPIESFDITFKGKTSNLKLWQYLANDCLLKLNEPFCFVESGTDSIKEKVRPNLHKTLNVCLSSHIESSYIGKDLIPEVLVSGKGINEKVKLKPTNPSPPPSSKMKIEFIPALSPLRVLDITKDQKIGSLKITNTCDNPLGESLIISKIDSISKCVSTEEVAFSPIKPGASVEGIGLIYKAQSFNDLAVDPFLVNCMIIVNSNAGVKNLRLTLVVTDNPPAGNQDEIIIPITPLPQLNIGVSDQLICYDGEEKMEVDLNISNWYEKPRKNVYLSLDDTKGVASLDENSFPEIAPNIDYKTMLLLDATKLTINKPVQVVISAKADYTYKVSKSVTIIKKVKEVAKPKIENFYSESYSIYANGQEYKVSTFEIVNDTQSASEIEAESADITSLRIEIADQEKTVYSTFFRIKRPKDFLKPQERVKCTVMLKIEREKFDKDSDYFSYRPVCDNQINYEEAQYQTQSMSINRQQPVEKSKISFDPERHNGYAPKDNSLLIGTIVLHKKRENPDSERYYDRVKESIGIVNKDFFFMNEEGVESDDIQTFGIEEKKVKLYWKVLGRENVFMDISLPIHYYCENVPEDNDKLIAEVYE